MVVKPDLLGVRGPEAIKVHWIGEVAFEIIEDSNCQGH
jgi:hypothetical protein